MCRTNVKRGPSRPISLRFRGHHGKPGAATAYGKPVPPPHTFDSDATNDLFFDDALGDDFANYSVAEEMIPEEANKEQEEEDRSTICAICSVDTGNFNLNYGANTCLSCRAFFRRAVQKTGPAAVTDVVMAPCKFGGGCVITEATRRLCKRCRFDKCVAAGMKATCVMKGEDIQERFAKYIERKKGVDKKATTMAHLLERRRTANARKERKRRETKKPAKNEKKQDLLKEAVASLVELPAFGLDQVMELPDLLEIIPEQQSSGSHYSSPSHSFASSDEGHSDFDDRQGDSSPAQAPIKVPNNDFPDDITALFDLDLLPDPMENDTSPYPKAGVLDNLMSQPPMMMDYKQADFPLAVEECVPAEIFSDAAAYEPPKAEVETPPLAGQKKQEDEDTLDEVVVIATVKRTRQAWARVSTAAANAQLTGQVVAGLTSARALSSGRLPASLVEQIRANIGAAFESFAEAQPDFAALPAPRRADLLRRNTPLFTQYLFGRALTTPEADLRQQLGWLLLLAPEEVLAVSDRALVRAVSAEDLCQKGQGTMPPPLVDERKRKYLEAAATFNLGCLTQACSGTVALLCLFDEGDGVTSEKQAVVLQCARWAHDIFDSAGAAELGQTLACVKAMAGMVALKREVEQPLDDLDGWVAERVATYDAVFPTSVAFGADFVKECVMYTLGVPLSRHFLPRATAVVAARFAAVAAAAEGGRPASAAGALAAAAVLRARLECCCADGAQQFELAFAAADKAALAALLGDRKLPCGARVVSFGEWASAFGLADAATAARFAALSRGVSALMSTPEEYKVLALLAMHCAADRCDATAASSRYWDALSVRLVQRGLVATTEEADAAIADGLAKVRELVAILQLYSDMA